jgi:hypothetical protein
MSIKRHTKRVLTYVYFLYASFILYCCSKFFFEIIIHKKRFWLFVFAFVFGSVSLMNVDVIV